MSLPAILRALGLAVLLTAALAASAGAHQVPGSHGLQPHQIPAQHTAQLLPAAALPPVDFSARMAGPTTRKCEGGTAGPYPCKNVDLAAFVPLPVLGGATGNDIWGWTDPETKREYALMGTATSTGFVDVTDAENPVFLGTLPTRGTPDFVLWRDIKVDGNYAYIVSEISRSGMQVFDLTRLRGRTSPTVFTADAVYDNFSSAHNISINEATDVAYVVGAGDPPAGGTTGESAASEDCSNGEQNGGLHMVDISDPLKPAFLGCALVDDADGERGTPSNNYVHDVECVIYDGPDPDYQGREICFGSNEEVVTIYDVTDKQAPKVLSRTTYPTATYVHQGALTENKRYFLFGDELDEQGESIPTTTYVMDVADLDAPPVPKAYTHPTASIDHNMYTFDQRVYQSNYSAGLRILEYDDASLAAGKLEEIAFFDVVPEVDIAEFAGTWSNYRFPGSGTVVVSAIENEVNGLFVLRPQLPAPTNDGGGTTGPGQEPEPERPTTKPQTPEQQQGGGQQQGGQGGQGGGQGSEPDKPAACQSRAGLGRTTARGTGRDGGVTFSFRRLVDAPVTVDVFQQSRGRRIVGERRVRRFTGKRSGFTWNGRDSRGRKVPDGFYFARFRIKSPGGRVDTARVTLGRSNGRFGPRRAFYRRDSCSALSKFKLSRPVFGGRDTRNLAIAYRLNGAARVQVTVTNRRARVIKRFAAKGVAAGRTQRITLPARGLARGDYRIKLSATRGGRTTTSTLTANRL